MASVEVLSATIAHAEEAKHEPMNEPNEIKKEDMASPPPPPPPPPSEQKQTDPETEKSADVAEPETLTIALETKAVLADEPVSEKKIVGSSTKVAPDPTEDKAEENAETAPVPESSAKDDKVEEEKPVEEEEKVSPKATVEKKEE